MGVLTFATLRDGPLTQARDTRPGAGVGTVLRDLDMLLLTVAGFGGLWGTWGFAFWANALMIRQRGLSAVEAGAVVSLVGVAAIIGKPLFGWLSDRMGGRPKWLIVGCMIFVQDRVPQAAPVSASR